MTLYDLPVLHQEKAETLIASFPNKRVLVVGDLMLDEYLMGEVRRISPEAPVPVVDLTHRAHVPGGASNVAANIASLGGRVSVLGVVGDDENAGFLDAALRFQNVSTSTILRTPSRPTITKTRIVSGQQQIVRIDRESRIPVTGELAAQVAAAFEQSIATSDVCVLSDYAKGLLTADTCRRLIDIATSLKKPIVVDPKGTDFQKYAGCTVMTPNLREAEVASGLSIETDTDLFSAAARIRAMLGASSSVLITRGADGMTLFGGDNKPAHVPSLAKEVFDVTGAGDTVVSALTLALAAGAGLPPAMLLSNLAASVVVGKTGTATLTPDELREAVSQQTSAPVALAASASSQGPRSYLAVPNQRQLM